MTDNNAQKSEGEQNHDDHQIVNSRLNRLCTRWKNTSSGWQSFWLVLAAIVGAGVVTMILKTLLAENQLASGYFGVLYLLLFAVASLRALRYRETMATGHKQHWWHPVGYSLYGLLMVLGSLFGAHPSSSDHTWVRGLVLVSPVAFGGLAIVAIRWRIYISDKDLYRVELLQSLAPLRTNLAVFAPLIVILYSVLGLTGLQQTVSTDAARPPKTYTDTALVAFLYVGQWIAAVTAYTRHNEALENSRVRESAWCSSYDE